MAGIINHRANKAWNENLVRFGWIDFIDDPEVSTLLVATVEEWGRAKGMTGIHGPLGFTDMDNEGMLVEGFEELAILTGIYNYPYYPVHIERLGFVKAADWIQHEFPVPDTIPEKVVRMAEIVKERYNIRCLEVKKAKELRPYAKKMWVMLNDAYQVLYGFAPISEAQMDAYTDQYFGFIRPEFVSMLVDVNDDVVGFGISLPNLTKALQKSNGRLFPFGFLHLLKAMKKNDLVDMYLVGVRPDYHGKGVTAMIFNQLHQAYLKYGVKFTISSNQLEENAKALTIWKNFEHRQHIRHRCYIRQFNA